MIKSPSPLSPQSRKFLEKLLADCRRNQWPGDEALITMIEETLSGKRPPEEVER